MKMTPWIPAASLETARADLLSVRDQFAAKALAALLTRIDTVSGDYVTNATPDQAAESAYRYADAMLLARARTDRQALSIEAMAREADCTHVDLSGDRAKALERLNAFARVVLRDAGAAPCEPTRTACLMPGWCKAHSKCAKREQAAVGAKEDQRA